MQSVGRLYTAFTQWLKTRKEHAEKNLETLSKTGARDWYCPEEGSSVREYSQERFSTQECQDEYLRMIKGEGLTGDMISVRFQAAHLKACERAFNLRHTTVPRLLGHANTENVVETNGLYDKFMTDYASSLVQQAKEKRNEKESD